MNATRKDTICQCVQQAGRLLLEHFGKVQTITWKENASSIVTAADIASEKLIFEIIRRRHPDHNLLGEESGLQDAGSKWTWVIDPLDGTSNFAAGLPWFGVMASVLEKNEPILAAMYLPLTEVLYFSARGEGVTRNGEPIQLSTEADLANTLCACGMDPTTDIESRGKQTRLLDLLVNRSRNLRLTNCLLDFCYTLEGRFGACINHNCKIWDIAPACLMFPEAHGCLTDLAGAEIRLELDPARCLRSYAVAGGPPALHQHVIALAREAGYHS